MQVIIFPIERGEAARMITILHSSHCYEIRELPLSYFSS